MPGDSKTTLSTFTGDAILAAAVDRLRPRLVAMILRRVSSKMAARIDPEGVVHDAFVRARPRWQSLSPQPKDVDAWVYGQVLDRLRELIRGAMGPEHDVDREVGGAEGSAACLAEQLVDSHTGSNTAVSRAERREVVRAALDKLDPVDREILALRHYEQLSNGETAIVLGLDKSAASKRYARALVRLKEILAALPGGLEEA